MAPERRRSRTRATRASPSARTAGSRPSRPRRRRGAARPPAGLPPQPAAPRRREPFEIPGHLGDHAQVRRGERGERPGLTSACGGAVRPTDGAPHPPGPPTCSRTGPRRARAAARRRDPYAQTLAQALTPVQRARRRASQRRRVGLERRVGPVPLVLQLPAIGLALEREVRARSAVEDDLEARERRDHRRVLAVDERLRRDLRGNVPTVRTPAPSASNDAST